MIERIGLYIVTLLLSMMLHEVGHIIILRLSKTPHRISWDKGFVIEYDNFKITHEHELQMIFTGIVIGVLPLLIIGYMYFNLFEIAGVLFFYTIGSRHDIKKLRKIK